jgi:prefoldin subunit 5
VTDPGRLCVAVGLGFFLEMTLPEALLFIQKRDDQLAAQAAKLTKQAAHIKAGCSSLDLILLNIILCKKCILMQLPRTVVTS